ncbi:exonuclease [Leptospira fluminis]|uniref:Exonuclease n=1 Tax=Leptospira fluminis TaxID=2484979 RepID=A0A4R9GQ81_9LEPT|nr:exonuclease [Leptospira fluminis]TGK19331.1 exonuclease [Leptospira fluminis]
MNETESSAAKPIQPIIPKINLPYLQLKSKDSFEKGERPYYDPEAERLLVLATDHSTLAGLKNSKIPIITDSDVPDHRVKESLLKLASDSLIVFVPRIMFSTDTKELSQFFYIVALNKASAMDPTQVKTLFMEIMRRSAWAIRNYEIAHCQDKEIAVPELLELLAENTSPSENPKEKDELTKCLNSLVRTGFCNPQIIKDAKSLILHYIQEDGFLIATDFAGYIYVPEQSNDETFSLIERLFSSKAIRSLVEISPNSAIDLVSVREALLANEEELMSGDLSHIRKKIYLEEFAKLSHTLKPSPLRDFFFIAQRITAKAVEAEDFLIETNEKVNSKKLKSIISKGKDPLQRFLTFRIGQDIPNDSSIIRNSEQDTSLLSYVHYDESFPELFVCPADVTTVREVATALSLRYSFENPTCLGFILMLNKYKNKLLFYLSDPNFKKAFCNVALSCVSKKLPWFVRFAYAIGLRESMISSILNELGDIQYKQLNERLKYRQKLSQIRNDLKKELVEEVKEMIYRTGQFPEGI